MSKKQAVSHELDPRLAATIEEDTGVPADAFFDMTPAQRQAVIEARSGRPMKYSYHSTLNPCADMRG